MLTYPARNIAWQVKDGNWRVKPQDKHRYACSACRALEKWQKQEEKWSEIESTLLFFIEMLRVFQLPCTCRSGKCSDLCLQSNTSQKKVSFAGVYIFFLVFVFFCLRLTVPLFLSVCIYLYRRVLFISIHLVDCVSSKMH